MLVFDGDTTAYAADGTVTGRLAPWCEGDLLVGGGAGLEPGARHDPGSSPGIEADGRDTPPAPRAAPQERRGRAGELDAILNALAAGLRHLDEVRGAAARFLVGVSGGVDSSLVTALIAHASAPSGCSR